MKLYFVFAWLLYYNTSESKVLPEEINHKTKPNQDLNRVSDFRIDSSPYIRHKERIKPKGERFMDTSFNMNMQYCQRSAKCQTLNHTNCMGARLPYYSTSLDLTDLDSQYKVYEKLQLYEQYLKYLPKCWAVIQPFLCALYMPKCEDGKVDLPSREMCRITLQPCQIVYNSSSFPEFFNCEDDRFFPPMCKNDIHEMKFNTTGYCMDPLIKTDKPEWWFKDVEGCGLKCKDSLYTENEHYQIHKLVTYCALVCILLNLFAVATFIIDWRSANKYPAKAIFYVNICFLISHGGWLVQFLGYDTKEDIVCKKDGTLRKFEPSATENLSCVIVFFMVYYYFIAGIVWFMIFCYAWYMSSLQALGKIQERVDKKRAYFHLVAWSLPLILTITTMAIGEIDGDYVTGICFVGFVDTAASTGLLLVPLLGTMTVSVYIIIRGLILLIKVKIDGKEVMSQHSSRQIQKNIVRMSVVMILMVIFSIVTVSYHIYFASNKDSWNISLQNYILCKLTTFSSDYSHCKQTQRPSVAMLQLSLLAIFGKGIAMASWVWCEPTLHAWRRYIRKKFHCEVEEPMKIQKHKIIARAFAKRKIFNEGGKISIFSQNHTDPVGLQFELNSEASNELSTTWAKNLPRLVNRRHAVPNEISYSATSDNQSIDSEVSLNVRHVSIESRRNSGDSQVSVQIAELKATRKVNSRRHRRHNKHHFRSTSRNIGTSSRRLSGCAPKRDSTTSLDSYLQILALTSSKNIKNFAPNLNRRTANAGLELSNGMIARPHNIHSGSEDENVSTRISEVDMRCHNRHLDFTDQIAMRQLTDGLNFHKLPNTESDEDKTSNKDNRPEKHYSKSGRDSHSSRKSKKSRRSSSCSESDNKKRQSDSSSCLEIKQLVSSLNSNASVGREKINCGSRQSKTSMDVAVQANGYDLDLEIQNKSNEIDRSKTKQTKTNENKRYRRQSRYSDADNKGREKIKRSKEKYRMEGSQEERKCLRKSSSKRCSDGSDDESLIIDNLCR
ncbi:protein smoothened [Cylas formicarius]|uniref:protein smoothened n=1 Tax=Cylas formicarius TaxID=197179 RepID=UPI002958A984|nr:protein smoothened [Cylas formicarius]